MTSTAGPSSSKGNSSFAPNLNDWIDTGFSLDTPYDPNTTPKAMAASITKAVHGHIAKIAEMTTTALFRGIKDGEDIKLNPSILKIPRPIFPQMANPMINLNEFCQPEAPISATTVPKSKSKSKKKNQKPKSKASKQLPQLLPIPISPTLKEMVATLVVQGFPADVRAYVAEGNKIYQFECHSVILESPKLLIDLKSADWDAEGMRNINIESFKGATVEDYLIAGYHGRMTDPQAVYVMAMKLRAPVIALRAIAQIKAEMSIENVASTFEFAYQHDVFDLQKVCNDFALRNFVFVAETPAFKALSLEIKHDFLESIVYLVKPEEIYFPSDEELN